MVRVGKFPMLECSSRGDKRFSAFYARIKSMGNKSIEELYQGAKVFEDGSTGLSPREAKGKKAVNMEYCAQLYDELWFKYLDENPELVEVLRKYKGYSDMFGRPGCQCQALSIYKYMCKFYAKDMEV